MALSEDKSHIIDGLQVLVLASPEIAAPIRDALEALPHVKCQVPHLSPDSRKDELNSLCSVIFPDPEVDQSGRENDDLGLFAWSRFDVVILQDLWLAESRLGFARLEFAGRVFASWDNDRGNFSTKKVVLVTDAALFRFRALELCPHHVGPVPHDEIHRMFDPKNSTEFISLSEVGSAIASLERLITGHGRTRLNAATRSTHSPLARPISAETAEALHDAIRRGVTSPVIEAAAPAIRRTILRNTSVLLVEDEEKALRVAYSALTGKSLQHVRDANQPPCVNIVSVAKGHQAAATNFKDLVEDCKRLIDEELAAPQSKQDVVIVTDILFELVESTDTGVDLIKGLRKSFTNRVGIVAFTAFKTPFVAMSAYLHGADYVVEKGGYGGTHETLQLSGTDRLLEALAFLCFQRVFLRRMRNACKELMDGIANGKLRPEKDVGHYIRNFEKTMPRHSVSLHLQEEWEDTLYLLKQIQIQSASRDELRTTLDDLRVKYGNA